MEVLQIFGLWVQETDLWFMNHKPLIPTMLHMPAHAWMVHDVCLTECALRKHGLKIGGEMHSYIMH